ncbi:MFS transporter [Aneurinibacillus sp. Ricciae_BoGa-3]|uniref:MFS transporter n=1 Tax=Aneurinibacillus sp. Ricciae_BoGa-3 TaxID=3022697 RepID=UPI0023427243|nr:MFS transporter [Aneurinibacillus sp. Ricciae_BoGa-3]WCK54571.1 MFS transporter [Aneurinibacillus sp. Ricciae_BoGa-3]
MKKTNKRWGVVILIFLATSINYLDRSNLGVAGPSIMKDLSFSKVEFGILGSAFFWTYTLMQIPVGAIVDKLGARVTYAVAIIWWSVFGALTAVGRSLGALIGIRALMGIGESPAFPTNTRVISDWLPTHERGFANGLFTTGIAVGAGLTTPAVAWIVQTFGWRVSFLITGALGIIWVLFWVSMFRNRPAESAVVNKEELDYILTGQAQTKDVQKSNVRWYELLKYRNVWCILYGLFAQDYLLYLMLTWLPTYLVVEKHMTLIKAGFNSILPWVAASAGALFGGYLSDRLVKKGWNPVSARKTIMTTGMLFSLFIIPAAFVESAPLAIGFISLSMGGMMFANGSSWAIVADIAPAGTEGTLAGMQNFTGNIAGWFAPILTGFLADRMHSFVSALVIAGIIGGIAMLIYALFLKNDNPHRQAEHTKTEVVS